MEIRPIEWVILAIFIWAIVSFVHLFFIIKYSSKGDNMKITLNNEMQERGMDADSFYMEFKRGLSALDVSWNSKYMVKMGFKDGQITMSHEGQTFCFDLPSLNKKKTYKIVDNYNRKIGEIEL